MSSHSSSRQAPANMPGSKAKQFLKRVLPRSIAILFATSALMLPVVIPAQVLVSDIDAEGNLSSIDGEMADADGSLTTIITDINNESVVGTPVTGSFPLANASLIVYVGSFAEQSCGIGAGVTAEATVAALAIADAPSPATILSPLGDPGGISAGQICGQLVAYRAAAYNDTASEVNQLRQYIIAAEALQNQADSAITIGQSSALTAQSTSLLVELQSSMAFWETRKESYQIAIQFLQDEQNALTQSSLKGNGLSSMISGGISATVLTGALAAITP